MGCAHNHRQLCEIPCGIKHGHVNEEDEIVWETTPDYGCSTFCNEIDWWWEKEY